MTRWLFFVLALLCLTSHSLPVALAEGYCPSRPNGKCPTPAKKTSKSRSDFTPDQRAKLLEEARQVCIKRYGASSTVYRFDYKKWKVICNTPGM